MDRITVETTTGIVRRIIDTEQDEHVGISENGCCLYIQRPDKEKIWFNANHWERCHIEIDYLTEVDEEELSTFEED